MTPLHPLPQPIQDIIDFTEDCIRLRSNAKTVNNGYGYTVTIDPDTHINYADPELLDKIAQWSRLDKTVNYVNVSVGPA